MSGSALTPHLACTPATIVRRLRELPVKGEIVVTHGARVTAGDVLGRAERPGEIFLLRVAEEIGVTAEDACAGMKVAVGDAVEVGTLLCELRGLFGIFKLRCFSPFAGTIDFISKETANVGVRAASEPVHLASYISGTVAEIHGGVGVTVTTRAAFVQGIFGVGGERVGALHLLDVPSTTPLRPEHFEGEMAGKIVVGGMCPDAETLERAAEAKIAALVTGSIDDRALAHYLGYDLGLALTGDEDIPFTIVVTEGFGSIPISQRIVDVLRPHHGRQASVNGATQVRAGAQRPEILVPLENESAASDTEAPEPILVVGAKVRVIRVPYFGVEGTITELPSALREIETGAHARVSKVKLADGREVVVPRANIELV